MTAYERYAIYYAPRTDEPLHAFGAAWFDKALETGAEAPGVSPRLPGMSVTDHAEVTAGPRRYGLHATLKPPFRLAANRDLDCLKAACRQLAAMLAPIPALDLEVTALGRFVALAPNAPIPALNALAARCVMDLDGFRAPPGEAELARRRAHRLTPAQEDNLARWGYPYVLNAFRFHVTLTGPVEDSRRAWILDGLKARLASVTARPTGLRDLCLFGDPGAGERFQLVARYPLG